MLSAANVIEIAAAVVALLQILKAYAGLAGRWALLVSALASALAVAVFVYSAHDYSQSAIWSIFAGWIAVFTSAAGVWNVAVSSPEAITSAAGAGAATVAAVKAAGTTIAQSFTGPGAGSGKG